MLRKYASQMTDFGDPDLFIKIGQLQFQAIITLNLRYPAW